MYLKISIIFCLLLIKTLTARCTTPNNEEAKCISLFSCPTLISALATQHSTSIEFVRRSKCGSTIGDPMVCCGSSSNFTVRPPVTESYVRTYRKSNELPRRSTCGLQHTDEYYRSDNKTAAINEFPWLALLIYANEVGETTDARCSGTLINTRYVLTSIICVGVDYNLDRVRLGDYNVYNDTDCTKDSQFYECSNAFEEIGIEKVKVNPNFLIEETADNNIALLRLNRSITYSDYIRPICLPLPGTLRPKVGDMLIKSGWGKRSFKGNVVDVKKKILSTLLSNDTCSVAFSWASKVLAGLLGESRVICTNVLNSNTEFACTGDGGGPVMFLYRFQWYLEGISYFHTCGFDFLAEIHLNVTNYVDWIMQNLEP